MVKAWKEVTIGYVWRHRLVRADRLNLSIAVLHFSLNRVCTLSYVYVSEPVYISIMYWWSASSTYYLLISITDSVLKSECFSRNIPRTCRSMYNTTRPRQQWSSPIWVTCLVRSHVSNSYPKPTCLGTWLCVAIQLTAPEHSEFPQIICSSTLWISLVMLTLKSDVSKFSYPALQFDLRPRWEHMQNCTRKRYLERKCLAIYIIECSQCDEHQT